MGGAWEVGGASLCFLAAPCIAAQAGKSTFGVLEEEEETLPLFLPPSSIPPLPPPPSHLPLPPPPPPPPSW